MANEIVDMTDMNSGDTIAHNQVVNVYYDNPQLVDLQVRLACPGSVVAPASHPAPAGNSGTVQFTVTHSADNDDEQMTARMTDAGGVNDFASDIVQELDVRGLVLLTWDLNIIPEIGGTIPYSGPTSSITGGIYSGVYTPSPGGNRVVVVVQRRRGRRLKNLLVRDAFLTVTLNAGALVHRFQVHLPTINVVGNSKVVVRALLLKHNDRVVQTFTYRG